MELIRSVLLRRLRPSPDYSWVSSCIISFVACLAFTHVTTYRLAKSPYATLCTGGSDGFVAFTAAPIATGWSDPVPRRIYLPLWTSAFHGALQTPDNDSYPPQERSEGPFTQREERMNDCRPETGRRMRADVVSREQINKAARQS
jgi:hypothetical protein